MAESQSMTTAEVVAKTLIEEHADFLADAVAIVAAQLMEAEITNEIGAGRGEVSPARTTHRNGYRPRAWETRVGEIELAVPRKRSGEDHERLGPRGVGVVGDRLPRGGRTPRGEDMTGTMAAQSHDLLGDQPGRCIKLRPAI